MATVVCLARSQQASIILGFGGQCQDGCQVGLTQALPLSALWFHPSKSTEGSRKVHETDTAAAFLHSLSMEVPLGSLPLLGLFFFFFK